MLDIHFFPPHIWNDEGPQLWRRAHLTLIVIVGIAVWVRCRISIEYAVNYGLALGKGNSGGEIYGIEAFCHWAHANAMKGDL